jgi:hypothetical protein
VNRRAAVRRRLDSALARASLVGELGVAHSFHRWEADRLLDGRATRRLDAFVERMWAEAAEAVGATVTKLDPSLYEFRRGDAVTRVAVTTACSSRPVGRSS